MLFKTAKIKQVIENISDMLQRIQNIDVYESLNVQMDNVIELFVNRRIV